MPAQDFDKPAPKRRQLPYAHLRALGTASLPERFRLNGTEYRLVEQFKHDFFAATGLYEGPAGRAVLKLGRNAVFAGVPTAWLGRRLVEREVRFYEQLQDLAEVPRLLGRYSETGFVHEFVPGHDLQRGERVRDDFFDVLSDLLDNLHRRGIAYVDMEKCENIIVGDDGRPYLIDFQISWQWPWRRTAQSRLARWVLNRLAKADRYHLTKHKRRCRPDLMGPEELTKSRRIGRWIKMHRVVSRPLTLLRRRILTHVDRVRRAHHQAAAEDK